MPTDPASLDVALTLSGLDRHEVVAIIGAIPAGVTFTGVASQPAIGGRRWRVSASGLSVAAARSITTSLELFTQRREREADDDE